MIASIKKLLGFGKTPVDYKQLMKNGGVIVDVRSRAEYNSGHIKNSINIPLDLIGSQATQFKNKEQAIITCCASGMRSASAKSILKTKGFNNVYNGGGWTSLKNKLS